jgi:hypothetical protein
MASVNHRLEMRKFENTTATVTVKLTREFRLRTWLAMKLITLASWIIGWRLVVKEVAQ